jgi:hypothetical protein
MSWDNQTPSSASWTRPDERTQSMDKGLYFLLKEMGDYILQENGYKILLQETWNYKKPITWAKDSLSSASFTNQPQMVAVWS